MATSSVRLAVGETVRDTASDRIGVLMDRVGGLCQLRPLDGGREWDARPEAVQPLSRAELMRARVDVVNHRSRMRAGRRV